MGFGSIDLFYLFFFIYRFILEVLRKKVAILCIRAVDGPRKGIDQPNLELLSR